VSKLFDAVKSHGWEKLHLHVYHIISKLWAYFNFDMVIYIG